MAISEAEALAHPAVVALIARLEVRIAALEAQLAAPLKTPANSSLPPSSGFKTDRAARRRAARAADEPAAKRGPKPGHRGVSRSRVPTAQIDQVVVCRPQQCRGCGTALPEQGGKVVGRQQVVELPAVHPLVLELQRLRVRCRHCGHGTVGTAPAGWDPHATFGPRLTALAAFLHEQHHVAYDRLVTLFAEVFGLRLSEGALVAAVGRLGTALVPQAAAIADAVRGAAVVGSDETSMRVDGQTWWAWVFQTPTAAVFRLQPRRNGEVLRAFLAGAEPGTWVSDLYGAQLRAPTARYQICLAHTIRTQCQVQAGPVVVSRRCVA